MASYDVQILPLDDRGECDDVECGDDDDACGLGYWQEIESSRRRRQSGCVACEAPPLHVHLADDAQNVNHKIIPR